MSESIASLAEKRIFLGTSSWKYEGWKGLVFKKSYPSEKSFTDSCLEEYGAFYPTVGVDHTYYAWPLPKTFQTYVAQTPENFRFGLKATERVTVFQYPKLKRYGKEAGQRNEHFLDAGLFRAKFLDVLEPFKSRLGPIMLEFSQFYPGMLESGGEFIERLDTFFEALGTGDGFQFGIEMRNQNWLKPPYFDLLKRRGVAHVFNSWTRMPPIGEQLDAAADYVPPCYVARLLLEPGTKYEEAVEAFSPYDRIQKEQPKIRQDTVRLIRRAIELGVPAYVFVNNRCEGCAPITIEAITKML